MKTFLILALVAMAATMATAQFDPSEQYQPYLEQLQPFMQQQQPFFWQQPFLQQQQSFFWQQPFLQQQQPFFWQQPFLHALQQQLNPCRQFLVQQCSPVAVVPFRRSQILQQSGCQVTRQQCCQQLAQIPEQLRCPAIHSVVQSIILQQQQQQFIQPQLQQRFFQPQQQAQFEGMRAFALQALPAMCDVYVPPHCSVASAPLGGI